MILGEGDDGGNHVEDIVVNYIPLNRENCATNTITNNRTTVRYDPPPPQPLKSELKKLLLFW